MKLKSILNIAVAIYLICISVSSISSAEAIRLVILAVNFPPYEIENPGPDGLLGFDVEVALEAFRRVDKKVTVEFKPWKRVVTMAKAGQAMAILSCGKTIGREEYIYYSEPISSATRTYVASRNFNGKIPTSIKDGQGFKVIVVNGYTNETDLISANIRHDSTRNDKSALNILLKRNFDFFYSDLEFVRYFAKEIGVADELQYFNVNKQVRYHLCFSKKWDGAKKMRDLFNVGLSEVISDGTYKEIHSKYK